MAKEAGALVEPMTEGREILDEGGVICANNAIFAKFAKIIRNQ